MPAVHSDNVWVPGQSAAPGSMSTVAAYEQIGKLCGTQTDLRCVGEHVASTWLAPTVAMHNENVAVSNLRESLKECAIPKERHDSWINTLCKYLGEPGKPAALKAPTSPESAPSVRTNDKKHQQHRRSLGKELGAEGLARLRKGFDRNIFSVKPTSCSGLQLLMKHPPPYSRGLLECSGLPLFVSQGGGKLIYCCFTIQALSGQW